MKKILFLVLGTMLLILGAIGIVLPLLPTTPFIVLAALCYSYSSEKFYQLLLKSKYFGSYIDNFKTKKGVPLTVKIRGIVLLWITLVISAFFMKNLYGIIMLSVVGIGVTLHLLLLKTKIEQPQDKDIVDSETMQNEENKNL